MNELAKQKVGSSKPRGVNLWGPDLNCNIFSLQDFNFSGLRLEPIHEDPIPDHSRKISIFFFPKFFDL